MAAHKRKINSNWIVLLAPLFAFPWMINLRVFPFVAPNEEPKWAVLTICALWVGLALAGLWFKSKNTLPISRPSLPAILLSIYTIILGIGIFIGPNMSEGVIRFAFWFFCIMVFALSAWAMRNEKKWLNALVWSVSLGSFLFSLRYWWSYVIDYGKPNYNIAVLFSPIGHINFTGDVLILLLPFLTWVLATKTNPTLRVLNWFSVTTIATILLVASSRGALGGLFIAFLVVALVSLKHIPQWKPYAEKSKARLPTLLVCSALLSSAMVYNLLPYHYRDIARVSATAGQTVSGEGKISLTPNVKQPPFTNLWVELSPLLGARTPIFASAASMALEKPWLGQGTGNFPWVYPSFSNRYPDFRDPLSSVRTFTTNPHNMLLQIASQNGFIAMFIFMGLLAYFWLLLLKKSWRTLDGYNLAGLAAMSAAIFDAMFNHVFFNPASMFVFALLAGSWWGHIWVSENKIALELPSKLAGLSSIVLIIGLSIMPMRWVMSEWYVGQAMSYVNYPSLEEKFYKKSYALDKENFRATFGMGQVAYKQKDFKEAIQYFSEFENFYPFNPPALNMLGAAYMMSGQFEQAATVFNRAINIYPGFEMAEQNLNRAVSILKQQQLQQQLQQQTP